jgi:hypothetical protein
MKLDKTERDSIVQETKEAVFKEAGMELFRTTDAAIAKSRVSQCAGGNHKFRKSSDTEVSCLVCPTVLILGKEKTDEMFPEEVIVPTVEPAVLVEEPVI